MAGDSGCPKNELPPYVLRQLGVGLAVPSRPVPYGIVTLRYAYSELFFLRLSKQSKSLVY